MGYLVVYSFDGIKSAHFFDTHNDAVDFINKTNDDGIARNIISEVHNTDHEDVFEVSLETDKTAKIEIIPCSRHSIKYDLAYVKNGSKPVTRRFSSKKNAIAYAHGLLENLDADPDPGEDEWGEWRLKDPLRSLTAHILLTLVILDEEMIDNGINISDYKILKLKQNATKDDIKDAFRKLAQRYHPDHGGDEKKFIEIRKAYERLISANAVKKSQKVVEEFRCFELDQFFKDLSVAIDKQKTKLHAEIRSKAVSLMRTGAASFVVGLILTAMSYSGTEPGGRYFIFIGLILVGIWNFSKGVYYYLYPEALIKKLKK